MLTIKFLTDSFKTFNALYFNEELHCPRFEVTHVKSYLGQYHWRYFNGIMVDSVIRISDYYDRSEEDLLNTLIHEMIHLYIRQNNIKDTRPHHGRVFNSIADRLNAEGGYHIARCDSVAGCGLRVKQDKTFYVCCYFSVRKNGYLRFVINNKKIDYYKDCFERNPSYFKNPFIYTSKEDNKFAHFRECRKTIRGEIISKAQYEEAKANENIIWQAQTLGIRKIA